MKIPETVNELLSEEWVYSEPRYVHDRIGLVILTAEPPGSDRARLAAQAPAMARLLLEMLGRDSRTGDAFDRDEIAATLRAAGVLSTP